ncbi:transposase [Streptomyces sp. NPDC002490]|uniref:IS701 family transposase n=1 Tax=Streptomyces sp. NPDC002490 TaxID=3154416 RepID=UPI0033292610
MHLTKEESTQLRAQHGTVHRSVPDPARQVAIDRALAELSPVVFSALPRADQRRKCLMYLRGLLGASGRKSVRNIAAYLGDEVNDQGLHHFINDSTWEWNPMREALGRHLVRRQPPLACVLHPMVIPKSGTHSVGVTRTFSWEHGQAVTAQQAIGVWGVSPHFASPLNWWLHLPSRLHRTGRPDALPSSVRAAAPDPAPEDSMVSAYRETAARMRLPQRPVILNAERLDGIKMVSRLTAAGLPHLTRIASDTWLLPDDPALPGWGENPLQAAQIAQFAKSHRRQVPRSAPSDPGAVELVAAVRVRLPVAFDTAERARDSRDLLLLGVGRGGIRWPDELWLSDMTTADHAALVHLIGLSRQVERHGVARADRVGIRDFVGRSFAGWHRHVTLASVAYLAAERAERGLDAPRPARARTLPRTPAQRSVSPG